MTMVKSLAFEENVLANRVVPVYLWPNILTVNTVENVV